MPFFYPVKILVNTDNEQNQVYHYPGANRRTRHIHTSLDRAILDAYDWPHTLTDEQILERLLALNLERAAGQGMSE